MLDSICGADVNSVYDFTGDCNTITGTDEVCQKALCNLDKHFAQELDSAVSSEWVADQVYTDVDNPGQCAQLGQRSSTVELILRLILALNF